MILFGMCLRMSSQSPVMNPHLPMNSTSSKFGCSALLLLVVSPFLSFWWGSSFQRSDGSGASWAPVGLIMTILIMGGLSLAGLLICIAGIKAREDGEILVMATLAHGLIVSMVGLLVLTSLIR